ncbi:MAG: SDR family oxidoreductase [Christensenellales bacterium]
MDVEKWALITGASSGIGREFSYVLARDGYNVVLVSRDIQRLDCVAEKLRSKFGVKTVTIQKDLSSPDSAAEIFGRIKDIYVSVLINNAGAGICGRFLESEVNKDTSIINTNITSLTALIKLAAAGMIKRGGGRILNVASTGAYQPGPYTAVYYATKAYVLSLSLAVRKELKGTGVVVCALCPGATATEFSKRAGKNDVKGAMPASAVAQYGYKGLLSGKAVIIPGLWNKIIIAFSKPLPGKVMAAAVAKIQRKLIDGYKNG